MELAIDKKVSELNILHDAIYKNIKANMNNKRIWYSKNSGWFQETYYPNYNLIVFLRKLFTGKPEGPQGKIVNKRI